MSLCLEELQRNSVAIAHDDQNFDDTILVHTAPPSSSGSSSISANGSLPHVTRHPSSGLDARSGA